MTREEAFAAINMIRNGAGVDRSAFPESMKAQIAKNEWNDGKFSLGFEYGCIHSLMFAFNITEEDIDSWTRAESACL